MTAPQPLHERLLDFEAARHAPYRKEALIRPTFACSAPRYYQQLMAIITPGPALAASLAYDPTTTARLLRLQEARRAARAARTLTTD